MTLRVHFASNNFEYHIDPYMQLNNLKWLEIFYFTTELSMGMFVDNKLRLNCILFKRLAYIYYHSLLD